MAQHTRWPHLWVRLRGYWTVCQMVSVRGWPIFHSKSILELEKLWPQTHSAFFKLRPPPSSGDASEYFLFQAPSSSPQLYRVLLPLQPLNTPSKGCSETSISSEGNSETSSNSAPSDLNSTSMFSRDSPSHSGGRAAPMAPDIKGHVIKVICDIKGQGWSGSVGNARQWPWSWTSVI